MQLNTYLFFNGECEAAFKFYERCLGGKIEMMLTHADAPAEEHVPAEWRDKILHASMKVGGHLLQGSDAPPGRYDQPKGMSLSLQINDPAEAERVFNALAENGSITMPFAQTFWALRFGMLVDQFDVPWMINCAGAA